MTPAEQSGDDLVATLRHRAEERKASGLYPEHLVADLQHQFERIAATEGPPQALDALHDATAAVRTRGAVSRAAIPMQSRVPGGRFVHRVIGKVVARQIEGTLAQVRALADAVAAALGAVADAVEAPPGHTHRDVLDRFDVVLDRLAEFERTPNATVAVADLRAKVERLQQAEANRVFAPWYDERRFTDLFHGTEPDLRERYRDLANKLVGFDPVVDIGCGRGEFLGLLTELGVRAEGVEADVALADGARSRGLVVHHGDGLRWLASSPDDSLGAIVLIQVVEHFTPQQVLDLLQLAAMKLRVGGALVIETPNPQSLHTFSHAFYIDPTHVRPVHPAYLTFLAEEAGFSQVTLEWRSPVPRAEQLDIAADVDDVSAENVRRVNAALFAPQKYALFAIR